MRLLFDCHLDETPFFIELMKYMEAELGVHAAAVTLGGRRLRQLAENGILTHNVSSYIRDNMETIRREMANPERYEAYRVDDFGLNAAISAERYRGKLDPSSHLELLIGSLLFWEEMFGNYDYVVGPGMAFTLHFTAYLSSVKRFNRSKYLAILTTRNPNGRVVFCGNHFDSWESVRRRYEELLGKRLTPDQERLAESFIRNFRQSRSVPEYMRLRYQKPGIRGDQVPEVFRRYWGYHVQGWKDDPYDYYTQEPSFYIRKYLFRFLKSFLDRRYFRDKQPDPGGYGRFLYFPLHFQPEATTLLQAPLYVDQINFLSNLSKVLPFGYRIVVKEHPSSVGYRPPGYYRRIEDIPNVTLLSPYADSHALIRKAFAVVVLSGTVGWEALLYRVPVIAFGRSFYNDSELVYRCSHYSEFQGIVDTIRRQTVNRPGDYDEMLKKFVVAIHECTYGGYFTVPKFDARVMSRENIRNIALAVVEEIRRREEARDDA